MTDKVERFDARVFSGITPEMRAAFERDGVLVLDGLISHDDCDALKTEMTRLANAAELETNHAAFTTTERAQDQDDYFLSSGGDIRFFLEEDALDEDGRLKRAPIDSLNKVGHALHDRNDVFNRISRQDRLRNVAIGLGQAQPLLLQSMYIFKPPHIGGEVVCHQDATYLWTDPQSVIGLWLAVEDAVIENGCLWGIPGEHTESTPKSRMRRVGPESEVRGTEVITFDDTPFPEDKKIPLEAPKGTLLAFGGQFPHLSGPNTSDKSRHAYALHVIDGTCAYPADNWLQRDKDDPITGF